MSEQLEEKVPSKLIDVLEHAALNGFNVILTGRHGSGKTSIIKELFDRLGWVWKYFSASTIDTWVDFVGIPKEVNGVLELIRPANLDFENVEAIVLDEYNRSPKKVRNATMELIQFGSINGKKFPKLKVVFVAVNPDDDDDFSYDVEKLDAAQLDRFHLIVPVPSNPCHYYFKREHGNVGALAVKWWQGQTEEVKTLISPRRLEAGVKVYAAGGDPQYVFDPTKVNIAEFCDYLDKPDPIELLDGMCDKPEQEKRDFLRDPNTYKHVKRDLLGKERYLKAFAHLLPQAELMTELQNTRGNCVIGHVCSNLDRFRELIPIVLRNQSNYSARVVDAMKLYQDTDGNEADISRLGRTVMIQGIEHKMSSLVFCFTGTISSFSRARAQEQVEYYGAKTTNVVTHETTHLVAGKNPGRKAEMAKNKNVPILTESDFYGILGQLEVPANTTA
jgi:hypothetical protein